MSKFYDYTGSAVSVVDNTLSLSDIPADAKSTGDALRKIAVSVTDFGAVGDGVTDCTSAIINAQNESDALFFPDGVYVLSGVTATKPWIMSDGAFLTTSSARNTIVDVAGDGNFYSLNFHLANKYPHWAVDVSGNNNHFEMIRIKGLNYDGINVNAGIMIHGNGNTFDFVRLEDFVQDASGNDSCPQGISLMNTATKNHIANVYARNCRSTVVNAALAGTVNSFGNVVSYDSQDNGMYLVRGGHTNVDTIIYHGENEAFVVITDDGVEGKTSANVGKILSSKCGIGIRFKNCGDINIGSIILGDCGTGVLIVRDNIESGNIHIDNYSVCGQMTRAIFAPDNRGSIESLVFGKLYIHDFHKKSSDTAALTGYILASAAKIFCIGEYVLHFEDVEDAYSDGEEIAHVLRTNITAGCIGSVKLICDKNMSIAITPAVQTGLKVGNGLFVYNSSSNKIIVPNDGKYTDGIYTEDVPVYGYWEKGQILHSLKNNVGMFYCKTAGTPGVWGELS